MCFYILEDKPPPASEQTAAEPAAAPVDTESAAKQDEEVTENGEPERQVSPSPGADIHGKLSMLKVF